MKGKWAKIFIGFVVILAMISMAGAAWASQDKPIKLLYAFFEPPQGAFSKVMKVFKDELEERTKGRVEVTLSFGGALGKPGEFYELTEKGLCDMAFTVPFFSAGRFPMTEIIGLPFILPSSMETSQAATAFYKMGYMDKELSDVKVFTISTGQGEKLFTKDKSITTLEDLKGKKIWASSAPAQKKIELLGAVPVFIPPTELYSALQKGIIDGFYGDWAFISNFKLDELVRYATMPAIGSAMGITVINKNKWNKLPQDIQGIIEDMTELYTYKFAKSWDDDCIVGKELLLKAGGKIVTWEPEEFTKIEKAWEPIWEDWIAEREKKGLPGRQAVDDMYNILKHLGVNPAAIGYRPK